MSTAAATAVETVYRAEWGRIVATLIRLIGDFELAEECAQEAFAAAVEQWRATGVPALPRAWIIQTARNKAIDRIRRQGKYAEKLAQVYESAGGFAPTIGIIGAVLGLIQVMQHLEDISEVGRGIAVAFVATIYGVGAANILFLPSAGKIKIKLREEQVLREMTLEGVVSILEGINPRMLETKLSGYLTESKPTEKEAVTA